MTLPECTGASSGLLLGATGAPAALIDSDFVVVGGNGALEELLALRAGKAAGKQCWEVFDARDVFGNPCCTEFCCVRQALLRNEPVHNFEMEMSRASGSVVRVVCATLPLRGDGPSQPSIVHLFQPVVAHGVAGGDRVLPTEASAENGPTLTERQLQILGYFAEGWATKTVARSLGISATTVRTHTNHILLKFGVHNLRQAIAVARRRNLI